MPQRPLRIALVLALASLPLLAKPTPEEWKKIEGEAKRAFAGSDGDARQSAALAVGAADCLDGVKLLMQFLVAPDRALQSAEAARDAFEPEFLAAVARINKFARQGKGLVDQSEAAIFNKKLAEMDDLNSKVRALSGVQDAIADGLAKTRDAEPVKYLVGEGLKHKEWRARAAVARALGFAPVENATVTPALLDVLADADARVRGASITALGARKAKEAVRPILEALKDEAWQVRVAACEALGVLEAREAVGPLIARMQEEPGRLREDIDKALKAITGLTFRADHMGWKGWWELNGADWDSGKLEKKPDPAEKKEGEDGKKDGDKPGGNDPPPTPPRDGGTVTFYGIETKSKNLVFVVDVSGSMAESADPAKSSPGVAGEKGKQKIDVARRELSNAIGGLPDDAKFNIVTFSTDVKVYSPKKMVVATKDAKKAAQKFADSLQSLEATNIHDALEKAFELAGSGGGMQVDSNYTLSVDTILFMTDGEPTAGKTRDPKQIGDIVKKWNETRKIRIHCIGVGKHAEDLLKRLADDSGGTYVKR